MTEQKTKRLPPFPMTNPELLKEWHYEKNAGIDPNTLSAGSSQRVWWRCSKNAKHEWDSVVSNRARKGKKCPYCAKQRVAEGESFADLRPDLVKELHPTKNRNLDFHKLRISSEEKVWWRCSEGHEWSTMIRVRAKATDKGCPECKGRIASEKNSLATVFPEIAAEWHPTKNGKLTPRDVTSKSHKRIWWKCPICLYEWPTSVHMRTILKSNCRQCSHANGAIQAKITLIKKQETELQNYDYETDGSLVASAQALRQMLATQIKTETDLKPIESLLSPRLLTRINYQPYYQRNYVWDNDKATYFIESVLIGTEVPPLIFFETTDGFEVIDGRQRFETLKRFQGNQFALSPKGLTVRSDLANKKFADLASTDSNYFFEAKLRFIRFSVVNPASVDDHTQDMLKKEIFRRYNSGITPLRQVDIEKAVYITDEPTQYIKDRFRQNKYLYELFVKLFLGLEDFDLNDSNITEKALLETRFLLVCAQMPIMATRNKETLQQYYEWFSESLEDVLTLYRAFAKKVDITNQLSDYFIQQGVKPTKYWNEVIYWALAILEKENINLNALLVDENKLAMLALYQSNDKVYAPAETQFLYSQFLNRYSTMAAHLESQHSVPVEAYIRKRRTDLQALETATNEDAQPFTRIEKQDPTSLSIEDLCRDIMKSRYLLRPSYQRNEVINRTKSSGIIESMLLGIKLPPLYAFKRLDGIYEVIDGQQRMLSIIGFLGSPFLNERGEQIYSIKNNFPLNKLRVLDLNGKTFQELDAKLQNRIWDYNLSIISIDEKFNEGFNPVDLFIRLNSRPYPIKENTFEMWNSYVEKNLIDAIKQITVRHSKWFNYAPDNLRMRNEELIAILTYLTYTQLSQTAPESVVDVYSRGGTIGVRLKQKAAVTRMMDAATIKTDVNSAVLEAIKKTDAFIKKVRTILVDGDAEDEADYLAQRLTALFNVDRKKYYARRYHDFYALWYLIHDVITEVAIRRRSEIRNDLTSLLALMKKTDRDDTDISPFISAVAAFKSKYAIAERKVRLSKTQKKELIKSQGNKCPLCGSALYITDQVEVDHIVPLGAQGADKDDNLQVVHSFCNRKKGAKFQADSA